MRNDCVKNAYDGFVIELAKYGMTARDLPAPVNFFSKVRRGRDRGDGLRARTTRRPATSWNCAPR